MNVLYPALKTGSVGTESGASPASRADGVFCGGGRNSPKSCLRQRLSCLTPAAPGRWVLFGDPALRRSVRLRRTPSFEKGTF